MAKSKIALQQIFLIITTTDLNRDYKLKEKINGSSGSIMDNIAEGFGRYFKKDKIKFYSYSKVSLKESFDWNEKAKVRKLITTEEYGYIFGELNKLPKSINSLIKFTNEKLPY